MCAVLAACPSETYQSHISPLPRDSLDEVLARGKLRVVSRVNPATFVVDEHGPSGIEFELARAFAEKLGVELEMIPAANIAEVYAALDSDVADVAASGLSQRRPGATTYWYSSPYLEVRQQIVYRRGTERPRSIADLVGKRVLVLAQSSSADALVKAQAALPALGWMEATRIETFELLRAVMEAEVDYAVVKSNEFRMHEDLFPDIGIAFELEQGEQLSWATLERGPNARLHASMQTFLARMEDSGELELLRERFYNSLSDVNRKALTAFAERVESQLPRYEKLLRKIGDEEGVDWRTLAAISYQESQWNPRARSRTGVQGMMMLTRATAREVGVSDRTNLEQSLRGGAKYFRRLVEQVSEEIPPHERELFALAAYNMGPAHVEDARLLAELRGADPNVWSDVEQQLPLLSKRAWHSRTRHGYARGFEALHFVNRIRQYQRFLEHHDEDADLYQLALNGADAQATLPSRS